MITAVTLGGIGAAAAGSACFALAAGLQHGAVRTVDSGGRLRLAQLRQLVAHRHWLAGALAQVAGGALHVFALILAPLVVVQPVGALAIPLSVPCTDRAHRPPVDRTTVAAMAAAMLGIGGFVALVAGDAEDTPVPPGAVPRALLLAGGLIAALIAAGVLGRGRARGLAFATAAGTCFGLVSALTRLLARLVDATGLAGLRWLPLAGIGAALLVGLWCVQQAHATGRADTAVACLTVVDPAVGVLLGALLFGEGSAATPGLLAGLIGCAGLAAIGVVTLALRSPSRQSGST